MSTTLQKELYGIAQASPYSSLLTIGNVSAPEGTVATVIIDEPMSGAFATILATAKDSLGPFQLCHLTKVECTDGTTKAETPFTDLACTSAVVLYSLELKLSAIPQGFDITAISNYIAQSAATVQALSGYKTAFISQAPENTPAAADAAGVVYSFYVEEQQPGLFGNITCSVLPPGGYACLIDAISNNVTGTCCSDLALCVPANTTYTLKFGKAVTQAAIMSELAALVTTMNAAQSAYTYSISSLSLGSDALSVQLNVSESEANTFGGLFCQSASQM